MMMVMMMMMMMTTSTIMMNIFTASSSWSGKIFHSPSLSVSLFLCFFLLLCAYHFGSGLLCFRLVLLCFFMPKPQIYRKYVKFMESTPRKQENSVKPLNNLGPNFFLSACLFVPFLLLFVSLIFEAI